MTPSEEVAEWTIRQTILHQIMPYVDETGRDFYPRQPQKSLSCTHLTCPAQPQSPTPEVALLSAGCECHRCPCWTNPLSILPPGDQHVQMRRGMTFDCMKCKEKNISRRIFADLVNITITLKAYSTIRVIIIGSPYVISFVDSMRMTVRLMVILTTPPRNAAAPMRAKVPA